MTPRGPPSVLPRANTKAACREVTARRRATALSGSPASARPYRTLGLHSLRSSGTWAARIARETRGPRASLLFVAGDGSFLDDLEGETPGLVVRADDSPVPGFEDAREDHARQLVVDAALDGAAQGTRPELRLETLLGYEPDRPLGELHLDALRFQASGGPFEEEAGYLDRKSVV